MTTKEETYNIATSQFESGSDHFSVEQSVNSELFVIVIASGTDAASQVDFSQGNTGDRTVANTVTLFGSPLAITGDGVFEKVISSFKGDFGIVKPANLTATVGTLKIQVKN